MVVALDELEGQGVLEGGWRAFPAAMGQQQLVRMGLKMERQMPGEEWSFGGVRGVYLTLV